MRTEQVLEEVIAVIAYECMRNNLTIREPEAERERFLDRARDSAWIIRRAYQRCSDKQKKFLVAKCRYTIAWRTKCQWQDFRRTPSIYRMPFRPDPDAVAISISAAAGSADSVPALSVPNTEPAAAVALEVGA